MLAKFYSVQINSDDKNPLPLGSLGHDTSAPPAEIPMPFSSNQWRSLNSRSESRCFSLSRNYRPLSSKKDLPTLLRVECRSQEGNLLACSGVYELRTELFNHLPTWSTRSEGLSSYVLFADPMQFWAIAHRRSIGPDGIATFSLATSSNHGEAGRDGPHSLRWRLSKANSWRASDGTISSDGTIEVEVASVNAPSESVLAGEAAEGGAAAEVENDEQEHVNNIAPNEHIAKQPPLNIECGPSETTYPILTTGAAPPANGMAKEPTPGNVVPPAPPQRHVPVSSHKNAESLGFKTPLVPNISQRFSQGICLSQDQRPELVDSSLKLPSDVPRKQSRLLGLSTKNTHPLTSNLDAGSISSAEAITPLRSSSSRPRVTPSSTFSLYSESPEDTAYFETVLNFNPKIGHEQSTESVPTLQNINSINFVRVTSSDATVRRSLGMRAFPFFDGSTFEVPPPKPPQEPVSTAQPVPSTQSQNIVPTIVDNILWKSESRHIGWVGDSGEEDTSSPPVIRKSLSGEVGRNSLSPQPDEGAVTSAESLLSDDRESQVSTMTSSTLRSFCSSHNVAAQGTANLIKRAQTQSTQEHT